MNKKSFKVIKIINEYKIVINAGKEDGIDSNSEFEIYQEGEEVFDPDTKENLGTMDYVKATVEAVDVFQKMCICRNSKVIEVPNNTVFSVQDRLLGTHSQIAALNIEVSEISGGFEGVDKKIHVGDKVRLV